MINDRDRLIEELFNEAADLSGDERRRWLEERCGPDPALRAEVETLLAHYSRAEKDFMKTPLYGVDNPQDAGTEFPQRIGSYRLVRKLGEGGMGVVYEATQENPNRKVALKVIRPGLTSKQMLRRFQQECEVLGRLQHPGIAHIYEAGMAELAAPGGFAVQQPFFAMEFVRGEPLNAYAEARKLGTRERLELLARVCDAVQHAHQHGVIHRDLKPGNILVVDEGGEGRSTEFGTRGTATSATVRAALIGQPKILDFGVARATDGDVQTMTLQTDVGQLVGTVPYMSPEQVAGDSRQLDTRADVYALGVILYELLSGKLPLDVRNRSIPEAARIIREDEPTRLSSVNVQFRGDIETIVAKALEKDKTRRYQSAAELADDIRRYLRDEPVVARPAGAMYQFGKFAKRNKALVGGVLAVIIVLTMGVIGTTIGMLRAFDAERLARVRLEESIAAHQKAEAEAEKARMEASKSVAVNEFLQEMLASVDPAEKGRDVTVRDAVTAAETKINDGSLKDQPEVEASVRKTIGRVYHALGMYPESETQLRTALATFRTVHGDQPSDDVINNLSELGLLQWRMSEIDEAEQVFRQALDMARALHGEEHEQVAVTMNNVGLILKSRDKFDEAEAAFRKSLAMRRKLFPGGHADIGQSLNNLAQTLRAKGDLAGSEPLYLEAMEAQRKIEGEVHPNIASLMDNLASLYQTMGRLDEAEAMFDKSLAMRRTLFGDTHPFVAQSLNNLAIVMRRTGRYDEAERMFLQALDIRVTVFGEEHIQVAQTLGNIGTLMNSKEDYAAAEDYNRRSLDMRRRVYGEDNPDVAVAVNNLAHTFYNQGRYDEAEPLYREALAIRQKLLPAEHPETGDALHNLAMLLQKSGRFSEAEPMFRQALDIRTKRFPVGHINLGFSKRALGLNLIELARFEEAEPLLLEAQELFAGVRIATAKDKSESIDAVARLYEKWEKPEQARPWREKLTQAAAP